MKHDFSVFFEGKNSSNQYNRVVFPEGGDVLNLLTVGLHNISAIKIVKEVQFHSHSFYEFHCSLKGHAVYRFTGGKTVKLNCGNWILIPENMPHKIVEYSENYIKFSATFSLAEGRSADSFYDECLWETLRDGKLKTGEISDLSLDLMEKIADAIFLTHPFAPRYILNYAKNIILETLYPLCSHRQLPNSVKLKNDRRLEIAVQFIKDNIERKITSDDVAKKIYLSTRQVDRIFLERMSVSVTEFIFEQRCEKAKHLLIFTSMPIRDISDRLGFSTPSYFNRFFKKRVGLSPLKFRVSNKPKKSDSVLL